MAIKINFEENTFNLIILQQIYYFKQKFRIDFIIKEKYRNATCVLKYAFCFCIMKNQKQ